MIKSKILKIFKLAIILLSFWFIGEKFWEHHNSNFNDKYDSDEEGGDFIAPRKRGPTINVKKTQY